MTASTYLDKWQQIPVAVKKFLLKGLVLLFVWKLLYLGFLFPTRFIDAPLTGIVGRLTSWGLNVATSSHDFSSKNELGVEADVDLTATSVMQQSIYFHDTRIAGVFDSCNALELMVLYAGFIVCIPARLNKKLVYITGGLAAIFIINLIRCIIVAYMVVYYPSQADFVHHYVLEFLVYASIIALWFSFAGNIKIKDDARQQQA